MMVILNDKEAYLDLLKIHATDKTVSKIANFNHKKKS